MEGILGDEADVVPTGRPADPSEGVDWAATPLGPPERWPSALRPIHALLRDLPRPALVLWGPAGLVLCNAAAAEVLGPGHRSALGRPVAETFPARTGINLRLLRAGLAGRPTQLHRQRLGAAGRDGGRWFDIDCTPVRDEDGRPAGVLVVGVEVTAEVRADRRRRRSEAEAARAARLLSAIGASTPDLIYAKDREGRFLYLNPACAAVFGRSAASLVGVDHRDLLADPAQLDPIRANDLRIMEEGRAVEFDEVLTGADGRTRIYRTVKSPLCDAAGAVAGLVGLSGDVTEARAVQAELERLNASLEARVAEALAERRLWAEVAEATGAMITVVGPDLRVLAANRAVLDETERRTGRRPRIGERVEEALSARPEHIPFTVGLWRRALGGESFATLAEADGRAYEIRFEPLRDPDGRVAAAFQIAADVTERVRDQRRAAEAEAARRDADALYRAYFETSAEGLFVIGVQSDGGFTLEESNPTHHAAMAQIGLEPQRGRRIADLLPPVIAEEVSANYRRVVETGQIQRYREKAEVDGRVLHVETVLVPVRDAEGRVVRIVGSGRDMTAQVQAEEAMRQAQKLDSMGQLTGGVAHDFNNLLTPIIGSLDMLQRRGVPDERMRRLVDGALQSAERARTLVQRLLAFARRQPLQPVAVDLGALVEGMADLVWSTVGPRIRVEIAAEPGLPPVQADANQLEMAILNLTVNARDAMPEGGALRLSVRAAGDAPRPPGLAPGGAYARLTVADTGQGMDEPTLARAVEPFFSTKGIGRGTGLGLSMVHGLASQLGGALALRSRPGAGTEVELWLPFAAGAAAGPPDPEPATGRPSAGLVLLVDDEELVRASTAHMLSEMGYAVAEASSAEEALHRIEEGLSPDLVVTDHLMPGLTGTDLARRLRAARPGLPVLVISGYAQDAGLPADLPRLTKPFRQAELMAALAPLAPLPRA